MPVNIKPVVGAGLASCCTIFSILGIVILLTLGSFFGKHVEGLTGSTKDPENPDHVAKMCYVAAIIYGGFVVFCGLQMAVHRRYPRGVQL
ncbi:hypothetical protein V866_002303 [Kwoniella sp. B9012]|uniref:DUF4190 domain-containing protein n=1 Tax=Kwoniella europaea PYCC6329 TaxID=1423913 RepID=A0AAX4KDW8_9TREE|nr:uncharacterized protein I203_03829 [Kwoniella mangroviensis CBS 8507]OCF67143.1 hypothetical protein I203_03829 [Kwoniella mangroviensis CBS 8507]OCF77862.1 hypothetical protein I204_01864 [Kwoniella mangroviensis CBS 8886]